MRRYLHLRFVGPMMSFGAAYSPSGFTRDDFVPQVAGLPPGAARLPPRAMLTGIIGNALGYDRTDTTLLQQLHDRLRFAAALIRSGTREQDFQTAQIKITDRGWTTRGRVEGRRGGPDTYASAHLRRHWYWADAEVAVALRLLDGDGPDLDAVAAALARPARPLFIGRKTHLPAEPIYRGAIVADDAHAALELGVLEAMPVLWDRGEGPADAPIVSRDDRSWIKGVHAGEYWQHVHPDVFDHPTPPFRPSEL